MWVNGYGPFGHSFVIWKDYNCHTWVDLDTDTPTTLQTTTMEYAMADYLDMTVGALFDNDLATLFFDPWAFGYYLGTYMNNRDPNKAFSTVVNQGHLTYYNARFCSYQG
jgi:hypothetical protein